MKNENLITILSIIIIPAIGVIFYWCNFNSYTFSSKPDDWGAFGNYFILFVGIINLIILYRISNIANDIQKGSLKKQLKMHIYNDFLQTLEALSNKIINDKVMIDRLSEKADSQSKLSLENSKISIEITLTTMITVVGNSMDAFKHLLDEVYPDFQRQCNDFLSSITTYKDNIDNKDSYTNFLKDKSELRIIVYKQIKSNNS